MACLTYTDRLPLLDATLRRGSLVCSWFGYIPVALEKLSRTYSAEVGDRAKAVDAGRLIHCSNV